MKIKVSKVEPKLLFGMQPCIILHGENNTQIMLGNTSYECTLGIYLLQNKDKRIEDDRLFLEEILQALLPKTIEEVYINEFFMGKGFQSILKAEGKEYKVMPSVAIFLGYLMDAPIYFDSNILEKLRGTTPII